MLNSNGRTLIWVLLVILIILVVYVIMFVPSAQPVKDFIANSITQIYDNEPSATPHITTNTPSANMGTGAISQPDADSAQTGGQPLSDSAAQTQISPSSPGSGMLGIPGITTKPFVPDQSKTDADKVIPIGKDNAPVSVLKACMVKIKNRDIIGAERFVSENGKLVSHNGMTGVHKLLLKNFVDQHVFDEIGYNDSKINGQTCWVPVYTLLDGKNRMTVLYIILANRGDGWFVDDLYNPLK